MTSLTPITPFQSIEGYVGKSFYSHRAFLQSCNSETDILEGLVDLGYNFSRLELHTFEFAV